MTHPIAHTATHVLNAGIEATITHLLLLGFALLVLIGAMMMPIIDYMVRKAPILIGVACRRVVHFFVDKLVESVVVGVLAICGGLWVLEMIPDACK